MERDYLNSNNEELKNINPNTSALKDINIELEDIENTLRNINLSYLNDNNELVENNDNDIIAPVENEPKSLFDGPDKEENEDKLEFSIPTFHEELPIQPSFKENSFLEEQMKDENSGKKLFDFSPLIHSALNEDSSTNTFEQIDEEKLKGNETDENLEIICSIEDNVKKIMSEKEKVDQILNRTYELRIGNVKDFKDIKQRLDSGVIDKQYNELKLYIDSFINKVKQNNVKYKNSEELNSFRI